MVFVARMMRASQDLADFKILLVNDRIDLEDQLAGTAKLIGGKVNVIDSTVQLREHLSTDASDLNMVMVHKFMERSDDLAADGGRGTRCLSDSTVKRDASVWSILPSVFCC